MQVYTDSVFWVTHSWGRTIKDYEESKLVFNLSDGHIDQEP